MFFILSFKPDFLQTIKLVVSFLPPLPPPASERPGSACFPGPRRSAGHQVFAAADVTLLIRLQGGGGTRFNLDRNRYSVQVDWQGQVNLLTPPEKNCNKEF